MTHNRTKATILFSQQPQHKHLSAGTTAAHTPVKPPRSRHRAYVHPSLWKTHMPSHERDGTPETNIPVDTPLLWRIHGNTNIRKSRSCYASPPLPFTLNGAIVRSCWLGISILPNVCSYL